MAATVKSTRLRKQEEEKQLKHTRQVSRQTSSRVYESFNSTIQQHTIPAFSRTCTLLLNSPLRSTEGHLLSSRVRLYIDDCPTPLASKRGYGVNLRGGRLAVLLVVYAKMKVDVI